MKTKLFPLILVLVASVGTMLAGNRALVNTSEADVVISGSEFSGQGTANSGSQVSVTVDGVTFTCDKAYSDDAHNTLRCYENSTITITAEGQIAKLEFLFYSTYTGNLENEIVVNATSWTQTLSTQARIEQVAVYFSETWVPTAGIVFKEGLYYKYNLEDHTASVIHSQSNSQYSGDVIIPSEITYNNETYSVTSVGDSAFINCTGLTSISIPNSVTSIGNYAFFGCSGLTSVTIPNSVTSIGAVAFSDCYALISVTLPNSVTSIGESAFFECFALTSVTLPSSVTRIGQYTFFDCTSLTSITIPDNVTEIGIGAFSSVPNVVYSGTATGSPWGARSINGYIEGHLVYNDNTKTKLLACSSASIGEIVIPNSVTSIGNKAFYECYGLTSVTIPNSVTSIGEKAFYVCTGLTSVIIPNSVTSIGKETFYYCKGLTSVTIPNSVTSIRTNAFYNCTGLTSVTLNSNTIVSKEYTQSSNIKSIFGDQVKEYIIGQNVTSIGNYAFYGCSQLTSISCEAEVPPTLGIGVFENTNNCSIYVPCGTLDIYKRAWSSYSSRIKYKPLEYTITITPSENGEVKTPMNICDLPLVATPNYGYHFVQWSDGDITNPRTIVLTQDTAFTAEFAKNTYTVQLSCDETLGQVSGSGSYEYLDTVELNVLSLFYGYHFAQWSDGNTENPRTIVLTQDTTLTAELVKNIYTITDNSDAIQGYIEGAGKHEYLDSITLTAIPNYGYHFVQWSDGNTENTQTLVLTQDTTFTAEFAIDKSGVCGKDSALNWSYEDKSKTLTITGEGELTENYTFGVEAPTQMKTLIISNDVTSIGDSAFYGMTTINHLTIGGNVASIGNYAFAECKNFDDITCHAQTVPTINATTFANVGNKQYIYLYVPEDRERAYKRDVNWGQFDVQIQKAETTTTDGNVQITPSDNTAEITWPSVDNAETYEIVITKDGEVVCTLIFNANGQLAGIAFAPGRNGVNHTQHAQTAGFKFTVTGLNSGTNYGYVIDSKNSNGVTIDSKSGSFTTTGGEQALEEIGTPSTIHKILRDGQILILHGEKTYILTGQEVR